MSPRLQLQLERERYTPGETVRGSVLVVDGGSSRSLEVWLDYCEETDDCLEVAKRISIGPLHQGELTGGASFGFELILPSDAFPNYKSEHGELYWQVDAGSDESGRDTHERCRIEVLPPGRTA